MKTLQKICLLALITTASLTTAFAATGDSVGANSEYIGGPWMMGRYYNTATSTTNNVAVPQNDVNYYPTQGIYYPGYWMMGRGWGNAWDSGYGSMMDSYSPFGSFMVFHAILWIIAIILIIVSIRRMMFWRKHGYGHCHSHFHGMGHEMPDNNKALLILQERYARWEIEKAEFEEKKKDLMG